MSADAAEADEPSGRAEAPTLLVTKLHPPFVPALTAVRERLFERLGDGRGLRLVACSTQQSNARHHKSNTVTVAKECERPHLLPAQKRWEELADYALDWATSHACEGAARA